MFCTQCGSRNEPGAKFCTTCGSPLAAVPEDATVAEVPSGQDGGVTPPVPLPGGGALPAVQPVLQSESQPAPQPGPAGSGAPSGNEGNDGGARAKALNRNLVIGIAVAAVALVAAVAAGVVTYSMELWGGKSLPDVAVASTKDPSRAADAKVVVRQLEGKGFKVRRVKEFSGLGKGKFLGYKGADSGARVRSGSTVAVRESLGPGVPDGTVGRKAERVVGTFADMGVPVHYKKVLVSDSSKTPEGSVVSTYPVQGQPVKDDKGIYIGVAAKGDGGLPSDIVGQSVSDVRSDLESKGYTVKVEKRLASKKNVGKVSGSEPGPGSQLDEGQTVTLYQGVDAKGAKQTYMQEDSGMDSAELAGSSDVASGQWCTKSGDCITLGHKNSGTFEAFDTLKVVDGGVGTKYSMTGKSLISCDAVQQGFCSDEKAGFLLRGDSGAFELMPHEAFIGYWCGDSYLGTEVPVEECVAGSVKEIDPDSDSYKFELDGSGKYRMMDLFAVFPVGSDVKSVEDDGYFDASALAAAKKQKAVDTDRPFLMYRDASQYKDSEKEQSVTENSINPFLPFNGHIGSKDSITKMKPAPSDETAYYLVEDTQPDWDSLEDANVKGVSAKSKKSSGTSKKADSAKTDSSAKKESSKNWKTMTHDEMLQSVLHGDFSPIAGKYCQKNSGACLTIDAQGNVTANGIRDYPMSPDNHNQAQLREAGAIGSWNISSDVGLELKGPDSDYRCGSQHGFQACVENGESYSEAEITRPVDMVYVFKGADPEQVKEIAAGVPDENYVQPDSSKPFIKLLSYHMNASPSDQDVFYLVE